MGDVVELPRISFLVQDALFEAPAPTEHAAVRERPKRDTKSIGDISEAEVLVAMIKGGYLVSKPFGENARYDLIADDGVRLLRIQVKTGRVRGDVIRFNCCSSHAHRGGKERPYFGQIDYIAVYCPETRKIYLIPESDLVATRAHLRLAPTRNGQTRQVRWASAYELA